MKLSRLSPSIRLALIGIPLAGATAALICVAASSPRGRGVDVRHDQPGQALLHRAMSLRDESGRIAPRGLLEAKARVAAMKAARAASRARGGQGGEPGATTSSAPAPSGTLTSLSGSGGAWTPLGPGNVGGRVRSLAIHPFDDRTMFAGSVSGGIWRTTDGGASWWPVDDFMANLGITAIVIHPTTPEVMYAATGEGFGQYHPIPGAGIFRSADGGQSWAQLPATDRFEFTYVLDLAVSADGRTLLAATRNEGIFRTLDGGATWTRATGPTNPVDLEFHPTDPLQCVAGDRYGRAWYSRDGGASWAPANLPSQSSRTELAYAPSNPAVVFAVVDAAGGIVHRSADGGVTFEKVFPLVAAQALLSQGWYNLALWVNPLDPGDIIAGGVDLWRSRDGGHTFTRISSPHQSERMLHVDHHAIVAHPRFDGSFNMQLFFANDGGIWTADLSTLHDEHTASYQELNNGLAITQFYSGAGNAQSGTIIGGAQDNGTVRLTAGAGLDDWTAMFGGDGGFTAADPSDGRYFYGEHAYLTIHRSTTGGTGSEFIYAGLADAGNPATANFVAPFVLDPNDPRRLLAGGLRLWRTNDARAPQPQWEAIKPPSGTAGAESPISAIAVAPGAPHIVWVAHNSGDVFATASGTAASVSWTKLATPFRRYVTRITIDPRDSSVVYLSLGGFQDGNVQKTTDGGASWTDVSGSGDASLPFAPVRDIEIHPHDSRQLFAATEVGVFHSTDGGLTWDVEDRGPANVSVDELFVMAGDLVAATYGRGLFRRPLPAATADTTPPVVRITSPSSGSTVSGIVTVLATATDEGGVRRVEWLVDGTVRATDDSAPYELAWGSASVNDGTHILTARAIDGAGNAALSPEVHVTVQNAVTGAPEIVLYAADATVVAGAWRREPSSGAAGGALLRHPDAGAAKRTAPDAQPRDYFELTFDAPANVPYHLWLRGRADADHWGNDSLYVQFSDSTEHRTGTTSAYDVVLEDCSGCGLSGWGWQDNGWAGLGVNVTFTTTGRHTIRVQTREDGMSVDQIVLSPAVYLSRAPGVTKNDTTILGRSPSTGATEPAAPEIVLYAADAKLVAGAWRREASASAAGGALLRHPDAGAAKRTAPAAQPADYFELTFDAPAGVPYHLWLRGRADSNHWGNDSLYVQFSDTAEHRIGTTSAYDVVLEDCSGCGLSGWGWQDNGWAGMGPHVTFTTSGPHTIRVQTREDGMSVDQIVLSPAAYLSRAPGATKNDATILPRAPESPASATAPEVVLYAAEAAVVSGGWRRESSATAAGGTLLRHPDAGAPKRTAPAAQPADYFELTFEAPAGVPYHLWIRGRADADHWGNDSLYVQFSDSTEHRIGTTSAYDVVLEDCSGCGLSGWGWQDNGWAGMGPHVTFTTTGRHTIRIQTREDGMSVDQVVLSPAEYLSRAPGATKDDLVVLGR